MFSELFKMESNTAKTNDLISFVLSVDSGLPWVICANLFCLLTSVCALTTL